MTITNWPSLSKITFQLSSTKPSQSQGRRSQAGLLTRNQNSMERFDYSLQQCRFMTFKISEQIVGHFQNQIYLKSRRWQVWSTAQQRIWTIWSAASRFSHFHFVKLPFFFSSCILFILSTFQGEKTHQEIVLGHSQFVVSAVVLGHRMARTILKSNVLNHFRRM